MTSSYAFTHIFHDYLTDDYHTYDCSSSSEITLKIMGKYAIKIPLSDYVTQVNCDSTISATAS